MDATDPPPAPGTEIAVRVTTGASRNAVERVEDGWRVTTTAVPEKGKATAMAAKLLARRLGIPKSRLVLVRGATSRDKVFRVGRAYFPGFSR